MIELRLIDRNHPVCRYIGVLETAKSLGLPAGAFLFRRRFLCADQCTGGVVAMDGEKLVGFFRYHVLSKGTWLHAVGTWVDPAYRRQGLATRMWKLAREKTGLEKIRVFTASRSGKSFVRSVEKTKILATVDHK